MREWESRYIKEVRSHFIGHRQESKSAVLFITFILIFFVMHDDWSFSIFFSSNDS